MKIYDKDGNLKTSNTSGTPQESVSAEAPTNASVETESAVGRVETEDEKKKGIDSFRRPQRGKAAKKRYRFKEARR